MTPYALLLAISLGMLPWSWRRSRSWTDYRLRTGAPIIWVHLGVTALLCLGLHRGDPALARGLGEGGLISSGLLLLVLYRRSVSQTSATESKSVPAEQIAEPRPES